MPPALRTKASSSGGADARLLQQVRGLLNRLAESNMQGIATQVPLGMTGCHPYVNPVVLARYLSTWGWQSAAASSRPMSHALRL